MPHAPWHHSPRAVALLASCAARPPRSEQRTAVYAITRDTWHAYVGYRAEALNRIRSEHGERLLAQAHRTDDYAPFEEWAFSATVEQAINAAIKAAATMQVAA